MQPVDVAWLAGLFEGEGWMEIGKNGMTRLGIGMTDRDIVDRVQALVPCSGRVTVREHANPNHRTIYVWRLSGHAKVKETLEMLMPWMGERRRARAQEVLDHIASSIGCGGHMRARTHCPQGHEYTPENTAPRSESHNYRRCKACQRESTRKSNEKRRIAKSTG